MNRASFRQKKDLKKKRQGFFKRKNGFITFVAVTQQCSTGGCNKIIESSNRQEIFSSPIKC